MGTSMNFWRKARLTKEVFFMATSSITKNFVISGKEQVEMFVNAIEESAKNRPVRTPVAARFVRDEAELIEFLEQREKVNGGRR